MATGNIDTGDSNDQCSPSTSALTHQPQNLRVMSSRASTISVGSTTSLLPKLRYALMAEYLQQIQIQRRWIANPESEAEGAFVRLNQGGYATVPSRHMEDSTMLYEAVAALNASTALTVSLPLISHFLSLHPGVATVPVSRDLRIQVVSSYTELRCGQIHQYAAFVTCERLLVVWDDDVLNLESRASGIIEGLTKMVWTQEAVEWNGNYRPEEDGVVGKTKSGADQDQLRGQEVEGGTEGEEKRKTKLINAVLVGITLCLVVCVLGAGWRILALECAVDEFYPRLILVLLGPVQVFFTLVLIGCIAQLIGPISQVRQNSRFYSFCPPPRQRMPFPSTSTTAIGSVTLDNNLNAQSRLPHITIQMPVYKESLAAVIAPTIRSIKVAMSTYALQGGSTNIFINDDGLRSLAPYERESRLRFYQANGIGWTARPNHGEVLRDGTVFVKKGKFKKASNMNYGLALSCRVEDLLDKVERAQDWTQTDEDSAYETAFERVLREDYPDALASGNLRIGDYILLIDSDTRVPADCLLDSVNEMEQSPEVGILQFVSGVMQVQRDYFENGITFFTELIYSAIRYTVSNGDVAPFVGHNALLRWSAVQSVSFSDGKDEGGQVDRPEKDAGGAGNCEGRQQPKFWSESHVSEDFDMSLRLQCAGYIIRLAAYPCLSSSPPTDDSTLTAVKHGTAFLEGVSLTVYDELARWEKYAFGCNELLFHPLSSWPRCGPFTPLFLKFLTSSSIKFTSKVTIISYIGTYYAIGAAWIATFVNYFLVGWYNGYLDQYYIDSWKVWFSLVIVFNGLGNVGLAAMRYRDEDTRDLSGGRKVMGFVGHLLTNFKYTILLSIFLGGLSLHVSAALLSHMFGYNMTWGATAKEVQVTNFFQEAPLVIRRFKWSFLLSIGGSIMMVVLGTGAWDLVRHDWLITDMTAIVPLATLLGSHALLPIVLNPGLMVFSY